jgi:hypothetical protein
MSYLRHVLFLSGEIFKLKSNFLKKIGVSFPDIKFSETFALKLQ